VNDKTCRQVPGGRYDSLAYRQAGRVLRSTNLATFFENLGTASRMDRSVDPAAAKQARIRRIDYRVDRLLRYIADFDDDATVQKLFQRN
jgi:hypothetical protein